MRSLLNDPPQGVSRLAIAAAVAALLSLGIALAIFPGPSGGDAGVPLLMLACAALLAVASFVAIVFATRRRVEFESACTAAVLEGSPDPALIVREAGDDYLCMRINPAGIRLFEPSAGEVPKLSSLRAGKALCEAMLRAAEKGECAQEVVLPGAIGEELFLRAHLVPLPVAKGRPRMFAILCRDLTAQRLVERELRGRSLQLGAIIDSAMDAVLITDAERQIIRFNKTAERMFGYVEKEMLGRDALELVPQRLRDELDALFRARAPALDGWRLPSDRQQALGLRRNGEEFPVEVAGSRVELDGYRLYAMLLRDMSERDSAESEIRALNERLEQRVAERTEELQRAYREMESFSYSVSHDLRAPLRAIHGYTYLLIDGEGDAISEDGRALLEKVMRASVHMGDLIDDFLDFSRVGRIEFVRQHVDMNRMVSEVLNDLRADYPDTACSIGVLAPASGDPRLLRQVWQNLISNALKFSARSPAPRIEIGMQKHGGRDWYFVADNGIGIDMDYADKLFGVFQRIHTAHEIEGTGIGLAIVKRVIERHQGGVRVEGVAGEGARFSFWVPD